MIIDNLVKKLQNCWDGKKLTSWKIIIVFEREFLPTFSNISLQVFVYPKRM